MKMKEKVLWVLVILSIFIGLYGVFFNIDKSPVKIGYVDIKQVFEEFEMKKELQQKLEKTLLSKQTVIDSLKFKLQALSSSLQSQEKPKEEEITEFQVLQKYFIQEKESFDLFNQEQTQQYNTQIISQMTQYIKDYGFNNEYEYILGSDENGNVLYGKKVNNLTQDIIVYINNSYQGY